MEESPKDNDDADPVENFLRQPAYHADEDVEGIDDADRPAASSRTNLRTSLRHFFLEKKASQYSSISPRTPDGRRTKIFPLNGNGRGR